MKKIKRALLNSPNLWKDSFNTALLIITIVQTALAVSAISFDIIWGSYSWIFKLSFIIVFFILLVIAVFFIKYYNANKGISMNIRGIKVNIIQGDIFIQRDWKVIPFNEFFDTTVDDIIINKNSLNGIFIKKYVKDINDLNNAIENAADVTKLKKMKRNGRDYYPLGRIIRYDGNYMLLAFTHFENNEAHLSQKDYEECLRTMWNEISRTYTYKPVFIPLLGSGVTRFDGFEITKNHLLKCMLCTLRTSKAQINQPITIVLTKEVMKEINIYEIKRFK